MCSLRRVLSLLAAEAWPARGSRAWCEACADARCSLCLNATAERGFGPAASGTVEARPEPAAGTRGSERAGRFAEGSAGGSALFSVTWGCLAFRLLRACAQPAATEE